MKDKDVWGFEWDDPDKAAKEMREEQFGPDRDFVGPEQFCYVCAEIHTNDNDNMLKYCPFCGMEYKDAKEARRFLAKVIDDVYPSWSREERDEYHSIIKTLRSVSPEFRQMWQEECDLAALKRRLLNGLDRTV